MSKVNLQDGEVEKQTCAKATASQPKMQKTSEIHIVWDQRDEQIKTCLLRHLKKRKKQKWSNIN